MTEYLVSEWFSQEDNERYFTKGNNTETWYVIIWKLDEAGKVIKRSQVIFERRKMQSDHNYWAYTFRSWSVYQWLSVCDLVCKLSKTFSYIDEQYQKSQYQKVWSYFFHGIISIKNLDLNTIEIDEKSFKYILIYYIGYVTPNIVNPSYVINKNTNVYTEESHRNKYLGLILIDENKDTLKVWRNMKQN